jgi:hypothetical protein
MNDHYPRIRLHREVVKQMWCCTREGVSICFYTRRYHHEAMQGVWRALETYCRVLGAKSLDSYADMDGYWQDLHGEGWELCRREMLDPRGALLQLQGGPEGNFAHGFIYQGRSDRPAPFSIDRGEVCTVVFHLPIEYLEERGPGQVRELAMDLAREIPFDSGHAGLCLHYMTGTGPGVNEDVGRLSFRYPGLDLSPDLYRFQPLGNKLNGVHWLNFLGPHVLGELGGVESLRARLHAPGATVQSLEGERALVTLGPWPESGDLEQGRTLPHYRELARVLEPWLFLSRDPYSCLSTQEEMLRWERRFLD